MPQLDVGHEIFKIINVEDHSIQNLQWDWWLLFLFITYYIICAAIAIGGQSMIIFYIAKYAPKERPINKMILLDQVNLFGIYRVCKR